MAEEVNFEAAKDLPNESVSNAEIFCPSFSLQFKDLQELIVESFYWNSSNVLYFCFMFKYLKRERHLFSLVKPLYILGIKMPQTSRSSGSKVHHQVEAILNF